MTKSAARYARVIWRTAGANHGVTDMAARGAAINIPIARGLVLAVALWSQMSS